MRLMSPVVCLATLVLCGAMAASPTTLLGVWVRAFADGRWFGPVPQPSLRAVSPRPTALVGPRAPLSAQPPIGAPALSSSEAERLNAAVPFARDLGRLAPPFILPDDGSPFRAKQVGCLADAVAREAAPGDLAGGAAVAQVVLNRLRTAGFPKTICGVVYEGAELRTGCQFTFTCDGSLAHPTSAPWAASARRVAEQALAGEVFAPVGLATHYHTQWVVPYWIGGLLKIAKVGPHIFYRRPGTAPLVSVPLLETAAAGAVRTALGEEPRPAATSALAVQTAPTPVSAVEVKPVQPEVVREAATIVTAKAPSVEPRPTERWSEVVQPATAPRAPLALRSSGPCLDPLSGRCG